MVGPSWGLNRRKYWRNFETSRLDFIPDIFLKSLPRFRFTESDFYETESSDFGEAIQIWAEKNNLFKKKNFIVSVGGMYGGYKAIQAAKPFILSRLLSSRSATANVYKTLSRLDKNKLFVTIHMRLGNDFSTPGGEADLRGKFNFALPMRWYENLCASLYQALGGRVEFLFLTDKPNAQFDLLVARYNGHRTDGLLLTECSDLLLMAFSDLRICSISSYSLAACYLSSGPYIWYEPQLSQSQGVYSIWGHENRQLHPTSPSSQSAKYVTSAVFGDKVKLDGQGFPVDDEGKLPATLIQRLQSRLVQNDWRTDLIQYGSAPLPGQRT